MWLSGDNRERDWRCLVWACVYILASLVLPKSAGGFITPAAAAEEDDWGTLVAVTAERGSTAKLPCNINSPKPEEPVLLVLWYKNASVTPVYSYDSRERDGKGGGIGRAQQWGDEEAWGVEQRAWFNTSTSPAHLLVRDVRGRDEGNYRCKVHFKASPSWSQKITLDVKDPPGFPRIQDESGQRLEGPIGPYEDGSTVRMTCLSSGEPPPGLVWGGRGAELGVSTDVEREGSVAKTWLSVVASRATSGTTVTCSTTNASVSSGIMNTISTTLRVNLPPLSVRLETPGDWVSGDQQTSFTCHVVGASPAPVIHWWLAGRQLTADNPLMTVGGNVSVSTVKLTPKPGDHGVPLVCKAFSPNLPGTVLHDQVTLAVQFVPVATISVSSGGGEAGVREGGSVTFTCHLKANPEVYNVTWFHNGRPLRRLEWGVQVSNTTLRLPNVTAAMRGLYTCVGSNQEGDGQSNAVNLNVEFRPVCDEKQQQEYVAARGGSVTVACSVLAYPAAVTFSWALKRKAESPPMRLHTVGREEGLTGHYTLSRLEEESVEVWCSAQNAVGAQAAPCRFTIYTRGRPGPVSSCTVRNHTASGFMVHCRPGPLRSMNTEYTLLVYTQKQDPSRGGSEERGGGSRGGQHKQQGGKVVHSLGQLVRNLTTTSPFFVVGGLQAGQEFALVVRVSNEEGVSPPVVLSAFTLKDNAQTVIGGGGRSSSGMSGSGSVGGGSSSGTSGGTGSGMGGSVGGGGVLDGGGEGEGESSRFLLLVPPMIMVLVASLVAILIMALLVILLLKRRGRLRRMEREMEQVGGRQVKLNEEMVFVHSRNPDSVSRETPSSCRKGGDKSETTPVSSGGSVTGGGGSGTEAGGGGVGPVIVSGTRVVGTGGAVGMVRAVDDGTFGSCNGDLLTTTSRDSLLGTRSKQGEMLESFRGGNTTLPILGVQQLGEDPGRHVVLEGMRPLGSSLSTSCSSFRTGVHVGGMSSVPTVGSGVMGGVSGLMGTPGLINTPATSSSPLLQVTLVPENVAKDRGPQSSRGNEGVSVL
ncbi:uncharacterized protein [Panulirus ornatus]|uniref:uncharacterized protein isoform X2 n=1 Tax=Panulirus ornatus TaxID=150431 RepID=UPI003A883E54